MIERNCDTCKWSDLRLCSLMPETSKSCLSHKFELWEIRIGCVTCKFMPNSGNCACPEKGPCWTVDGYELWDADAIES